MARVVLLLLFDIALVSLAVEDCRKRKIPNHYAAAILLLSVIAVGLMPEVAITSRVLGMFAVSVPMSLLALMIPGSFGGGDVKLVFSCGAFLGFEGVLKGTVSAVFLAGGYCIWLICIKKNYKNVQFALGPFLSAGYLLSSAYLFKI